MTTLARLIASGRLQALVPTQYLTLVAGIALAAAMAAASGGWQTEEQATTRHSTRPFSSSIRSEDLAGMDFVYYFVGSSEQKDAVLKHEAELVSAAGPSTLRPRSISIFFSPSEEEIEVILTAAWDLLDYSHTVSVVDLRSNS